MSSGRIEPVEGQSHWCEGLVREPSGHARPCVNIVRNDSDHCEAGHKNTIHVELPHHDQTPDESEFPVGAKPDLSPETDEVSPAPTARQSHSGNTPNVKTIAFPNQVDIDCRGGRRIPLRFFRPTGRALANGVEILQYCEQKTRSVSQGRALREMATGRRMPTQWPPRESYEYRHLLAIRRVGEEIQLLGSLEDEGQRPTYARIGAYVRWIPFDETHWLRAVSALTPSMAN